MFTFDDEFGIFDEDAIFGNEEALHEAPNDTNKKENKGQNGSGDNTESDDDTPTDYTDAGDTPNTPVDDEGNPDYTEEQEPDYDEESDLDQENDQSDTDSESDDTNTEVKSDEGDGDNTPESDTDGNIDDTNAEETDDESDMPDYTSEEDPSAADGEPGDDADGAGDEEAMDGDDTGDDVGGDDSADGTSDDTTGGGGDGEISQLQNDLFSNLSDEQMKLRINSIKDSFIELYSNVDNTSKQILLVNRSSDNIVAINYINETLGTLKDMIRDALTDSFNTRSIAENQIVLQKLVAIYSLVYKIVEKIGNRKEEK